MAPRLISVQHCCDRVVPQVRVSHRRVLANLQFPFYFHPTGNLHLRTPVNNAKVKFRIARESAKGKEQEGVVDTFYGVAVKCSVCVSAGLVLWHNDDKGECVTMSFPSANEIKHRRAYRICVISLPAIGAILLLAAPAPRAQNAAQQGEKNESSPAGNAENGKKIFTKDGCYECHGREGQGAAQGAGPRIGPPQLSFEAFTKYVHQPTGQMPPYTSKVISDQDLADIYAYLQSRPKATPSKNIPLLNQ
jgi:mono/diheme cytochrome c family protein